MSTSAPTIDYFAPVVASMRRHGFTYQDLCRLMFGIVDEFCEQLPESTGPGRTKTYPDSTILKLDMLMHLTGKRGETAILREAQRHYRAYFDKLPDQSRLWYRIRDLLGVIETFSPFPAPTPGRFGGRIPRVRHDAYSRGPAHLSPRVRQRL